MLRLYRIPFSTNVERVALALAHKGLEAEAVWIEPNDRSEVERISGQPLVPVLDEDGRIIADSAVILRYLEERYPQPPLYPADPARRAELEVFVEWFYKVWKGPPNAIADELSLSEPDRARVEVLGAQMAGWLGLFEDLLAGRDYLCGEFSAADCIAFPFLKYALLWVDGDEELFHEVLRDFQPLGVDHPRLEAWIRRVDERPRA